MFQFIKVTYSIFQIAEALLEKETLTFKDMEELIGPPIHKDKISVEWGTAPTST